MLKSLLEYPLTRPIVLNHFGAVTLIATGFLWVVIVTLINVAAVGYEVIPITSMSFNSTYRLWYEKLVSPHTGLIPRSWTCEGSIIKRNEGSFQSACLG